MLKSNFELALAIAIQVSRENDTKRGIRESAYTGGLVMVLEASQRGEQIEIREN